MKIAIDISQIVYQGTGVANYTSHLVKNLLKIDKENQYLLFGISFRQKRVLEEYFQTVRKINNNVSLRIFPIPQTIGTFIWNKLHILSLDNLIGKVDVFHSSDWIAPPTSARKVTTVHDLVIYRHPEYSHPKIIENQKRRLYWVKREVDLVLADSYATKNDLVQILHFKPDKIEVVYPGVSDEFKQVNSEEIIRVRQKYQLKKDYILSVGTKEPRKNLRAVLAAYERFQHHSLMKDRKRSVELVIVGKKGWGDMPKADGNVRILGFIDQKDLPGLYSGASLFIYPSIFEGFGLPVMEAMACGVPVITSNKGSLEEIARDAVIFVDPQLDDDIARGMIKVFIDNDLKTDLIKKGIERAANFRWRNTAGKVKTLYEKLHAIV